LIDPIIEYDHTQGSSVTGGFVYHGSQMANLVGRYIYADFASGRFWSYNPQTPSSAPRVILSSTKNVASFGEDNAGELYAVDYIHGDVSRLASGSCTP
jgi:hypothetical protein